MSRAAAIDYLRPLRGAPWRWEDNGNVLAWSDGTTLAFRPELVAILERLEPTGLPWFGVIVLTLAASRGKMPHLVQSAETELANTGRASLLTALSARGAREALGELHRLANLPPTLTATAENKAVLVEAVLDKAPRWSAAQTAPVLRGLREGLTAIELNALSGERAPFNVAKALLIVADGLRRHTNESLLLRLGAGLDALPETPGLELDLPRDERARRLFRSLQDDAELGGLVAVVRDLLAALRLPRVMALVDETAAGGVSDIGNRGSPDRLLLSELAHDDLTLAARMALNEALYLRREPPAHQPQRTLAVLLDSGVRMWGVPRVLGAAAALALVSRHPNHDEALAWRAQGHGLAKVDLLSRRGLEAHLGALVPDAHPGAALPAWRIELARTPGEIDAVVVTHRDVFADEAFQARVAELAFDRAFALVVERDGTVELHALPWGAPRPLAQATIDIAKLFPRAKDTRPPAPLITAGDDDFPAIFRAQPFPLRLPVDSKIQMMRPVGNGGVCMTADKRMLFWERPGLGARQLATDLPSGRAIWLRHDERDRVIAVKSHSTQNHTHVIIAPVSGTGMKTVRIACHNAPMACHLDGDTLLLFFKHRVIAVSLEGSEVITDTTMPPAMEWISNRYFWNGARICFANWNGSTVAWTEIHADGVHRRSDVITAFDRNGAGAWILHANGWLLTPDGTRKRLFIFPISRADVRDDGNTVIVLSTDGKVSEIATADSQGILGPASKSPKPFGFAPALVSPPTRPLHKELHDVGILADCVLRVVKSPGPRLELVDGPQGSRLWRITSTGKEAAPGVFRPFAPFATSQRLGCSLRLATWPDGSRAWLDSRGLLHLRSSAATIPEISLVISTQSVLSAWCSDGAVCGTEFFLGPDRHHHDSPQRVGAALDAFCRRLC